MKMTGIENLTTEKHERTGLDLVAGLPSNTRLSYYYGTWSFSNEEAKLAEYHLMRADTPTAWMNLGKLYEQVAFFSEKNGCSEFLSQGGSCNSRDLTAYWAVRAYLKADKEDKATKVLTRFGKYPNVPFTLINHAKPEQLKEPRVESPENRQFDLPDLDTFPNFRQALERMKEGYL